MVVPSDLKQASSFEMAYDQKIFIPTSAGAIS